MAVMISTVSKLGLIMIVKIYLYTSSRRIYSRVQCIHVPMKPRLVLRLYNSQIIMCQYVTYNTILQVYSFEPLAIFQKKLC